MGIYRTLNILQIGNTHFYSLQATKKLVKYVAQRKRMLKDILYSASLKIRNK